MLSKVFGLLQSLFLLSVHSCWHGNGLKRGQKQQVSSKSYVKGKHMENNNGIILFAVF